MSVWRAEPARTAGPPSLTILAGMVIAIGGAAVSAGLDFWLFVRDPTYLDGREPLFSIVNLSLVALSILFLVGMWHHAKWAWRAAFALAVIGAVLDCVGVVFFYLEFGNFGGITYFGSMVAPNLNWGTAGLFWPWVHLVAIEALILALLWHASSRRWVGIETSDHRSDDLMRRS